MRAVKSVLPLILLIAIGLGTTACDTLANRRSFYSPKKGDGYWTRTLETEKWKERQGREISTRTEVEVKKEPATPPPAQ